jgi:hypothetical protein
MLKVTALFFLVFAPFWVAGQAGAPGNSYASNLLVKYPGLKYAYIDSNQTHDYSGNWDLDGDGEMDGVYFVGNGGVHLFFYLRVVCGGRVWDLRWVEVDMPMLGYEQFAVDDFDGDGVKEINVRLGRDVVVPRKWRRKGVKVGELLIRFGEKALAIENFSK